MKRYLPLLVVLMALCSCGPELCDKLPEIFPDYIGVTVPEGIAPLSFDMADGRRCRASVREDADTLWYSVVSGGRRYREFPVYVSHDAIDPYVAYRLIEPGYESWHDISIRERELSGWKEKTIVDNRANDNGCLNCHTFQGGSPGRMLFHARGKGGGTVFVDDGAARIINLASTGPGKQGVYPAWHPSGRYVAFSSNNTQQSFTVESTQPIEVYDTASDIILMDTLTDSIIVVPQLNGPEKMETFPAWSPSGDRLYYCCADSVDNVSLNRGRVHYRLMSIAFDGTEFVGGPETVWEDETGSASFPRVYGDWLLFTRSGYGTFPIWHTEADLWLINLVTGECFPADEVNSADTESYHSWSSNGRWIVFSSRRLDGRYTRLFFSHFDGQGHFTKPFLLPQKKASDNVLRLKSYNIPEFVSGEVPCLQEEVSELF